MSDLKLPRQSFPPDSGGHGGDYPELDAEVKAALMPTTDDGSILGGFFPELMQYRVMDLRRGYARLATDARKALCQPAGVMHGGASFGLADSAVAWALMTLFGTKQAFLTVEMKMTYLEGIPMGSEAIAEAYILRSTRNTAYSEVDVWCEGKLAGRANTTYMIRPLPGQK